MKKVVIEHSGEKLVGAIAESGTSTWFSFQGEVWVKDVDGQSKGQRLSRTARGKAGGKAQDPSKVFAPMPGKIVKVMVDVGQMIEPGAAVIVMEAMKMEYTLKSSIVGKVKTIACSQGMQVSLGMALVEFEVIDEKSQ